MKVNWHSFNRAYDRPFALGRGEEKELTEEEVAAVNNALEKIIEYNKIVQKAFDRATNSFYEKYQS